MTRRGVFLAALLLVAIRTEAADPVTASAGIPARLRLAPPPANQHVVLDVTMLAASGLPASATLSLRGVGSVHPLGQLAPYPATFDTKAGDPAQQSQFDVTEILRANPGEHGWTLQIDIEPLAPSSGAPASRQTFVARFAPAPR